MNKTLCEIVGHIRPSGKTVKIREPLVGLYECERCRQYIVDNSNGTKEVALPILSKLTL